MAGQSKSPEPKRPETVRLRPRRSPKLIALGVLCVVLGALTAAAVYTMNVTTVTVLAVTQDLPRGHVITTDDLRAVEMPEGSAQHGTPADQLDTFVGATTLTDLPEGSLPDQRHVGDRPLPEGHSLVGLRLEPGRVPVSELAPGTQVQLIGVESDATFPATLATTPALEQHGTAYIVDVIVADDQAATVASLAAANTIALVAKGDI